MKKLKVAVIGCGYLGTFHSEKVALNSYSELIGVYDIDQSKAVQLAAKLNCKCFSTLNEIIGQVDAVVIATITGQHAMIGMQMVEAGIHCNIEKPLTHSLKTTQELIQFAEKKSARVFVGHNERLNPAFQALKSEIAQEPILRLEFIRHAPFKGRGGDVSVCMDLLVHDLDLLLNIHPGKWEIVSLQKNTQLTHYTDDCYLVLKSNNTIAQFSISRLAVEMKREIRAITLSKTIKADLQVGKLEIRQGEKTEVLNLEKVDALQLETNMWIDAILNNKESPLEANINLPVYELLNSVESSESV